MKRPGIGAPITTTVDEYCTTECTLYIRHMNMTHGTRIWMGRKQKKAILNPNPVPIQVPI